MNKKERLLKILNGEKAAVATAGTTASGTVIDKVYVDGEVATGTYSATVSVADAEFMQQQIEQSQLSILPASHLSNIEQPEGFTQVVQHFIEVIS